MRFRISDFGFRIVAVAAALAVTLLAAGCAQKTITPVETSFNKGVYHQSKGNYDEAIAEYRSAIQDDPADYRSRFNLGTALEARALEHAEAGRPDQAKALRAQAEAAYASVLQQQPSNVRAAVNLAALRYERGDRDGAKAQLREMIGKHADLALPRNALAAWLLRESDTSGALSLLEDAARIEPANLMTNYLLGEARWKSGDTSGALAAFDKALLRQPDDIATLMARGKLNVQINDLVAARTDFQSVLYVDPDHLQAHHNLASVLEKLGDLEGAVGHTWRARDLSDDPKQVAAYNAKLDELYRRLLDKPAAASTK
ncbi:MAG: tetratricopeptide repeat protein [Phycisphaera sp.]|nr:tetratricopeptide repeat protein [Phycisphaera sp.]